MTDISPIGVSMGEFTGTLFSGENGFQDRKSAIDVIFYLTCLMWKVTTIARMLILANELDIYLHFNNSSSLKQSSLLS